MLGEQIEKYTIKSLLGQGGMATVYLAHDNKFDTQIAIKVLNKEFVHNDNIRKRFLAEAKNMFRMSHPNIIKVTDLIDEGDTVAFVMEYMEGETLKEYLERKGKLNDEEIKTLFSQMLDAVGYVHEQNLVHRDIKPSNFMITPQGKIKLLDFGIAKNTDSQSADYTQTGTTQNMGTPMYMSPEQIKSTKDVTLQSDIYSLGVVLWQMVMGKKPYDTNTSSTYELQNKIVTENLSLTNSKFDSIIEVATAKEINFRYKNCNELKTKLENLQKHYNEITKVYSSQNSEEIKTEKAINKKLIQVNHKNDNNQVKLKFSTHNSLFPARKNNLIYYLIPGLLLLVITTHQYQNWMRKLLSPELNLTYKWCLVDYSFIPTLFIFSIAFLIIGYFFFIKKNAAIYTEIYKTEKKLLYYILPGLLFLIISNHQYQCYKAYYDGCYSFFYYNLFLGLDFLLGFSLLSIVLIILGYLLFLKKSKLIYKQLA